MMFDFFGKRAKQENRRMREQLAAMSAARRFDSAVPRGYNHDFLSVAIKTNSDLRRYGESLRNGSRELAKNNCDYRRYLAMCERNVVGANGFRLQMNVRLRNGKKDEAANRYLEEEYARFSRTGNCTVNRRHSMRTLDKLIVRNFRIDGEVFLRRVRGFRNGFDFAWQLLDPAACPFWYNDIAENGNRIRMGIELDEWDAPTAYYFLAGDRQTQGEFLSYEPIQQKPDRGRFVRIDASEINHFFTEEFVGQLRGFPFGQAAMQCLNLLDSYFYVELVAADAASRKLGKMVNEDIPETAYTGRDGGGDRDGGTSPVVIHQDPGSWDILYGKWDMKMYDPQHPAGNFPPFVKAEKRNIANGLDVAYNTFANDLEGVNFSSIRSGVLDEREAWMDAQETMIEQLKVVEFGEWLRMQFLRPDFRYDASNFDRLNAPVFLGRRWPWVDPRSDAESCALQIALGATTPQDVAANLGNDFDENVEAIGEALEKLAPAREFVRLVRDLNGTLSKPSGSGFDDSPGKAKEETETADGRKGDYQE